MSEAGFTNLRRIFDHARALSGPQRQAYLDQACANDLTLRQEVDSLLHAAEVNTDNSQSFGDAHIEALRARIDQALEGAQAQSRISVTARQVSPQKIGRYRILCRVASGGMGTVYEAEQESPKRRVALKMVHGQRVTQAVTERLQRESEILGRLQHPGIAQVYDAGMVDIGEGAQPFFAMEFIEGVSLTKHADVNKLDDRARLELLATVCDAVHYAHGKGVVHRDLKPDNILVDGEGRPKVLDFGVARITSDSTYDVSTMTRDGQILGTLSYMAPEQMNHGPDTVTAVADVYALGVIGFELLTQQLPLDVTGRSVAAALKVLLESDPKRLSDVAAHLRGDVQTIIGKALEREPGRRYESAAAMAADIRRYLAHQPITARPPSSMYRSRKFVRRNRTLVGGTLATILVLIAGLVVSATLARQERAQRQRADANLLEARHGEARIVSSIMASVVRSLDAGRLWDAFDEHQSVPDSNRGWAWRLMALKLPYVFPEFEKPAQGVEPFTLFSAWRFFDDDHLFVFDPERGCVRIAPIENPENERELFCDLKLTGIGDVTATGLAVGVSEDQVFVLDLHEGTVRDSWTCESGGANGSVSNDGRVVALRTSKTESKVWVDGELRDSIECPVSLRVEFVHCLVAPDGRTVFVNRQHAVDLLNIETGERVRIVPRPPLDRISAMPVEHGWISHEWLDQNLAQNRTQFQTGTALDSAIPEMKTGGSGAPISAPRDGRFAVVYARGSIRIDSTTSNRVPRLSRFQTDAGVIDTGSPYPTPTLVSPTGNRLFVMSHMRPPCVIELNERVVAPGYEPRCSTYRDHEKFLYHLAISHDGSLIASLSPFENLVRVWDAITLETIATTPRRMKDFVSQDALMAFAQDDSALIFTSPLEGRDDVAIITWNLLDGTRDEFWPSEPVISANHAPLLDAFIERAQPRPRDRLSQKVQMLESDALAIWRDYRTDFDWPRNNGEHNGVRWHTPPQPGRPPKHDVVALAIHPTASIMATVGAFTAEPGAPTPTGRLTIRNTADGAILQEEDLRHYARCAAYSPDGSLLALGTHNGRLMILETEFYTVRVDFQAHSSHIYSLAWMPDGHRLVTASGDSTVRIWDDRSLKERDAIDAKWGALRESMAARNDLEDAIGTMTGDERAAARIELIRRGEKALLNEKPAAE